MKLFCNHNYTLINQVTLKSEFEIIVDNGYKPNTGVSIRQKLITDYKCSKCGRIKRFTEETCS